MNLKPTLLLDEDETQRANGWGESLVIDSFPHGKDEIIVVWKTHSVLEGEVLGISVHTLANQTSFGTQICEISFFLGDVRIGFLLAEEDLQKKPASFEVYKVHQSRIAPELQKQGLGLKMYHAMASKLKAEYGKFLREGDSQTCAAVALWDALERESKVSSFEADKYSSDFINSIAPESRCRFRFLLA